MYFEWDPKKDKINRKKHHIDFMTASRVFDDEDRIELVVYTVRKQSIRIISARKANEAERSEYYDGKEKY